MKTDTTRTLSLRRTLLFTAIGVVLAFALALSSITRFLFTQFNRILSHHHIEKSNN